MRQPSNRWALVLAAGSGTRLSSLTRDGSGAPVPKQFCSLNGGASLLEEALARAATVACADQTIVVVAGEQRRHWQHLLAELPRHNVVVQPRNRGTANGILLGVSAIVERAADAVVAILPSDHYVEREEVLATALDRALAAVSAEIGTSSIGFLGIEPEFADPELGYIMRGTPRSDGSSTIARFIEKPARDIAARLLRRRALWNSFVLVARGAALMELIAERHPVEVTAFQSLWRQMAWNAGLTGELERLYARLSEVDFSRDVVEGAMAPLHVVPVPECGWSDLGTPQRVAECLARLAKRPASSGGAAPPGRHFNLADSYARLLSAAPALQTA
jgi:mannose-1-phosphate guanylyltransferase